MKLAEEAGAKKANLNPNSEIQTGKMTQDLGAETNRKNRGIPKAVCRDFFNSFMPKRQGPLGWRCKLLCLRDKTFR
jgi:hypothetical protein